MDSTAGPALSTADRMAIDRTRLAHERTLMAWVRTSMSLISFGFTIYKAFQYVEQHLSPGAPKMLIGPRGFALIMISIGMLALVLGTLEHRRSMLVLRTKYGGDLVPYSLATVIAACIALLGVLAFLGVVLRQ